MRFKSPIKVILEVKMNVLLKGYFFKNLGDDLMVKNLCDRYPNITFEIVKSNDRMGLDHLENINNIRIRKCSKVSKYVNKLTEASNIIFNKYDDLNYKPAMDLIDYDQYDAFVEIGGSIFSEKTGFKGYPYILLKRRLKLLEKIENGFF